MKSLTSLQIIAIHEQLIKRFGGSLGLRDLSLLESAIGRPFASYGEDLYESVYDKAAALFHSILKNRPFVDGNKRTAYSAAAIFLKQNGFLLKNVHDEAVNFSVRVETENLPISEISKWLEKNSTKL